MAPAIGESIAHVSSAKWWAMAVVSQIVILGFFVGMSYAFGCGVVSASVFAGVPWRLLLWASLGVYMSLAVLTVPCMDLFLPRTPVAVQERFVKIGMLAVGVGALGLMDAIVLGFRVEDRRVLLGCTCVVAASIVGLLAFWVWLARKYGGHPSDSTAADSRV